MLSALTLQGLEFWRHGEAAPLWRALATPYNSLWLNLVSALVVSACFGYAIKNTVFKTGPVDEEGRPVPPPKLTYVFAGLPLLVIPQLVDEITGLSSFYFSLVPSALSLALMASQAEGLDVRLQCENDEAEFSLRALNVRLFLSGICAAVGAWEGLTGVILSVIVMFIAFQPAIRLERSVPRVMLLWLLGWILGFLVEGICLGWPWEAICLAPFPAQGFALFVLVSGAPVLLTRVMGSKSWLIVLWGLLLTVLGGSVIIKGRYWQQGGAERFVRKVLSDLGERKVIIGDCMTDPLFEELKPSDVRVIGTRTREDLEFLLADLDERSPLTNRALVVRHYYDLPETAAMRAELGFGPVETEPGLRPIATTAAREAMSAVVAVNALNGVQAATPAVERSIREVREDFKKTPEYQRKAKLEEARVNIRWGWANGMEGAELSSTILKIDALLEDWDGAETDALMALLIDREDVAANAMLGRVRLRKCQYEEAEKRLRTGVKGGEADAYNDLAKVLVQTARPKEAEVWSRMAVKAAPADWTCHETLVQVLVALNEPIEATRELAEVERLAKERGQSERAKEAVRLDRAGILRLRGSSNKKEEWGQDASDRWGE